MKKVLLIGIVISSLSFGAAAQGFGNLKDKKTASAVDTTKKTGTQTATPTGAPVTAPSNNTNAVAPKPTKTVDTTIVGGFGEV